MIIISMIVFIVLFTVLWLYTMSIYEVKFQMLPERTDSGCIKINIIPKPLNAFGKEILFRKVCASYEITDGKEFVDNFIGNASNAGIVLKPGRNKYDTVTIIANTEYSLFPSLIEIR